MTATALTPTASQKYNKGKYVPGNLSNLRVVYNYYDAAAETAIDAGDGDYVNLLVIPANSLIVGFGFNVLTA